MLNKLNINIDQKIYNLVKNSIPNIDFKLTLNEPTGNFFYDPWTIKNEYKNTVWEDLINSLQQNVGEARLINIDIEKCYTKHADIDNRWHYAITGQDCFLVDLEERTLHELQTNTWYYMDAGKFHSAVNFGCDQRINLVVRKLLNRGKINSPKHVEIILPDVYNSRFLFDMHYSTWLNDLDKKYQLDNFTVDDTNKISFVIDTSTKVPQHRGFVTYEQE